MEFEGIVDWSDIFKVDGIGDFQAFHSIVMSPFLEMLFEWSSTPITKVTTNLAFVLDPKPM